MFILDPLSSGINVLEASLIFRGAIPLNLLSDITKKAIDGKLTYDYKTLLQEYIHSKNIKDFSYELVQIKGPEHDQVFTSKVVINNKDMGEGDGKNKKESEQHAAFATLKKLKLI